MLIFGFPILGMKYFSSGNRNTVSRACKRFGQVIQSFWNRWRRLCEWWWSSGWGMSQFFPRKFWFMIYLLQVIFVFHCSGNRKQISWFGHIGGSSPTHLWPLMFHSFYYGEKKILLVVRAAFSRDENGTQNWKNMVFQIGVEWVARQRGFGVCHQTATWHHTSWYSIFSDLVCKKNLVCSKIVAACCCLQQFLIVFCCQYY